MMNDALARLTDRLAKLATHYDMMGAWPVESLEHLTRAGSWTWAIPAQDGGLGLDLHSQLLAYEAIAGGCLSSCMILAARDTACRLVASSDNQPLRATLLPELLSGKNYASVGLRQLRGPQKSELPPLRAGPIPAGYQLDGVMPWVTGAGEATYIVAGAVLPEGEQVLGVLRSDAPGVMVGTPMKLMAAEPCRACEVHCHEVILPKEAVLHGPMPRVPGLLTPIEELVWPAISLGLAGSMIRLVRRYCQPSAEVLAELRDDLTHRFNAIRERLYKTADVIIAGETLGAAEAVGSTETQREAGSLVGLRATVDCLLVRLATAVVMFADEAAFIRQMDAQRYAREALFLVGWAASEAVCTRTLGELLDRPVDTVKSMDRW